MIDLEYQRKYWRDFTKASDIHTLSSDLNDSWSPTLNCYIQPTEIEPDMLKEIQLNTQGKSVLDFGFGMGRNTSYLAEIFEEVHGYDTPEMIERLKLAGGNASNKHCQPQSITNLKFDLLYETTVFQHMPPNEVLFYLAFLSKRCKYFFSWTRCYNDFFRDFQSKTGGVNIFSLIESSKCFEVSVVGENFNQSRGNMDESHYKILYKSLNYND